MVNQPLASNVPGASKVRPIAAVSARRAWPGVTSAGNCPRSS
jgi:hypothetical protein